MKYIKMWPNAVYYRPIKDIAKISRGKVMSKEFLRDNKGEFPVYSSQTDNDGMLGSIKTYMFDGEYITWTTDGANAGTVFYRKGKFSITNVCGIIEIINPNILTKYVFYALKCETLQYVSKGMGNPKLMSNVMEKIHIPIPPSPSSKRSSVFWTRSPTSRQNSQINSTQNSRRDGSSMSIIGMSC